MSSNSISEFVQFCPAGFDEVQRLIFLSSNVALIPYQPGFSRDIPIYYFLISYIYLINRYLQVNFLVPLRRHMFDPYLKIYTWPTTTFIIQTNFQSQRAFKAYGAPCSQPSPHPPQQQCTTSRDSQHIVLTTPRKLLSWELCLTSGWHWLLVTSPSFCFLTCLWRLILWTMTSSLPDWIKHLQFAKRRCSGLEHTFQEEVKQYYLRPHAMLNSSFN